MSHMDKPDMEIVVTIPAKCNKETVQAMRAVCDGIVAAMNAGEYKKEERGAYSYCDDYTYHHFTRSVRFEVEPAPEPLTPEMRSEESQP